MANIIDIKFDKSFYRPGEAVHLTVHVFSQSKMASGVKLEVIITHLAEVVDRFSMEHSMVDGDNSLSLTFTPPAAAPRGYGLELHLQNLDGEMLDTRSTAFDVLARWTQSPRYGFLSDFPPDRGDIDETIATLNRYHINGLQFYDWMYRHEQSLTTQEPYVDLLGRQLSLATVNRFIASAHERNIAAMPYTAVYGSSLDFYRQHPDWVLLNSKGEPMYFGEDYLVIMDIRPGSPWVKHMMAEFDQILSQTAFDGIHLDQYGDPKDGYDAGGNKFGLAGPLAEFINETKVHVLAHRPDGAVVFNAVTNWPIEGVAPADQDLVYIEVWPPYNWFNDLHNLIVQAQDLSGGKAVVLAAYIDPQLTHNVLLADAVIFASGGARIELGEKNAILADAYFPKYGFVGEELTIALQRYYDFAVRYQDVIGPRTQDATRELRENVEIKRADTGEFVSTAANAMKNKIWPIVRSGNGLTSINLINLLGLDDPAWKEPITSAPTALGKIKVSVDTVSKLTSRVWFATPDGEDLALLPLEFSQEGGSLVFEIPSLAYWDLIVIEWEGENNK